MSAKPVAPVTRLATLDILRGCALLGMIIAHVYRFMGEGTDPATQPGMVGWLITHLVSAKARMAFAFLFGAGAGIMLRRLEVKGLPVGRIFLRRLAVLYVVGFAVVALTGFEILREYAWWGVPLLFLRNHPTRSLLALCLICAAAYSIRDLGNTAYHVVRIGYAETVLKERSQIDRSLAGLQAAKEAQATSWYRDAVVARVHRMVRGMATFQTFTPDVILTMFILGLLAVRHDLFVEPIRHRRLIAGFMFLGILCWVGQWWVLPMVPEAWGPPWLMLRFRTGFGIVDESFLSLTFIGMVTLWLAAEPRGQRWLAPLAWPGRMAFTHYLIQAVVIDVLAAPYGFGLRLQPYEVPMLALLLFGLQVGFSRWWLRIFRYGPVEWVWRSLTYWQWQSSRPSMKE